MRSSISCSHKYDKFLADHGSLADYGELSGDKKNGWSLVKYKILGFLGYNTGAVSYNWQSVKYKILSVLCFYAGHGAKSTSNKKIPKKASELKALELKTAKVVEKKFLRTKNRKCPYVIKDISIDGETVKLTVVGGALYSPVTMLQSEFFTKNHLNVVNFKFTEGGSEISVEKTSNGSFNYVVTKGSVIISQQKPAKNGKGACATVAAYADGSVRVTDIEKVRERYKRHQLSGVDILVDGVSLFDMLYSENWKCNPDGTYVTYVSENKAPSTALSLANCVSGAGPGAPKFRW